MPHAVMSFVDYSDVLLTETAVGKGVNSCSTTLFIVTQNQHCLVTKMLRRSGISQTVHGESIAHVNGQLYTVCYTSNTSSQCLPSCHSTAPQYLSDLLHRVSDITSRRCLQSSTSSELVISLSWLVTIGNRSFAVAGPRLWNTLLEDIISAPSLLVFRRKLKTHFFRQSYPDII